MPGPVDPKMSAAQTGEPLPPPEAPQGKVILYDANGDPLTVHSVDANELVKSGGYSRTPPKATTKK